MFLYEYDILWNALSFYGLFGIKTNKLFRKGDLL